MKLTVDEKDAIKEYLLLIGLYAPRFKNLINKHYPQSFMFISDNVFIDYRINLSKDGKSWYMTKNCLIQGIKTNDTIYLNRISC